MLDIIRGMLFRRTKHDKMLSLQNGRTKACSLESAAHSRRAENFARGAGGGGRSRSDLRRAAGARSGKSYGRHSGQACSGPSHPGFELLRGAAKWTDEDRAS